MIERVFYQNYDLDSLSFKYGKLFDRIQADGPLKGTGGASTSLYSVSASYPAFGPILVGDYIYIYTAENTIAKRRVATKPSNDEITVDSNVTVPLAGLASWYFASFRIGTADTDGWHSTNPLTRAFVNLDFPTITAAGGVDVSIEVKSLGALLPKPIGAPFNFPAGTPVKESVEVTEMIGSVRVGLKGGSGFAGTDDLSVTLTGVPKW